MPQVAWDRWLDSLTRAGWSLRPGSGGPGHGRTGDGQAGDRSIGDRGTGDGRDSERVAVGEALGRVTVAPVVARWPSPRTDCAAMDGVSVRAADLSAAPLVSMSSVSMSSVSVSDAGTDDGAVRLAAGMFEWIDTGDPMPVSADTVVVRERLLPQSDGSVIITPVTSGETGSGQRTGHAPRGQNVRAVGEDFAAGEVLVPAGRRLRPGDLAAAAAGGHASVTVARRPVVAIIPTGDEIRPVGAVPRWGDIIDTNSLMLSARCRQLGAVPVVSAVVPDNPDALAAELRHAAAESDLVLVIAGSSRGRGDHAPAVLSQVGGVAVAGVAVRPGHPALLGHAKRAGTLGHAGIAPVIGLPGYPLATAVIFELFAVPLLAALQGHVPTRNLTRAELDRDWTSPAGVEDWILVTLTPADDGGVPLATPARRGAGSISQLARAAAWWPIPACQGTFTAGTPIEILPIPATG